MFRGIYGCRRYRHFRAPRYKPSL